MELGIRRFENPQELLRYIDSQLADIRKKLGELLRVIEDLRAKTEQVEKLKSIVSALTGGETAVATSENVINLDSVSVVINPSPSTELRSAEELAESLNKKLSELQSIRRDVEKIVSANIDAPLEVVIVDGVPKTIMIKL